MSALINDLHFNKNKKEISCCLLGRMHQSQHRCLDNSNVKTTSGNSDIFSLPSLVFLPLYHH